MLQAFGTFMLWFGWYGFNPGSTLAITPTGAAAIAARVTVCTTLSAAFGGMTVCPMPYMMTRELWGGRAEHLRPPSRPPPHPASPLHLSASRVLAP